MGWAPKVPASAAIDALRARSKEKAEMKERLAAKAAASEGETVQLRATRR